MEVPIEELRIGVIGSVDSGKSTLTGVLTKNILDDGRGLARSKILRFPHEKESGRTSSVAQHFIRKRNIKEEIKNSNYDDKINDNTGNTGNTDNTGDTENTDNTGDTEISTKKEVEHTIGFIDLAGHEKYLKTTVSGINRCYIDYACVVVGSNMGVLRMTIEHIGIVISMNIPTFIVMTKIDLAPPNIRQKTYQDILKLLKKKANNSSPILIKDEAGLQRVAQYYNDGDYMTPIPIFQVSSVHGNGIDTLKKYIDNLQCYQNYEFLKKQDANFVIECTYMIKGIGLVVSGIVRSGIIKKGDTLHIGPFDKIFHNVIIKSIHNNFQEPIFQLEAGQSGCFSIKINSKIPIKRNNIRKGSRIMKHPNMYSGFKAIVKILHHPTTIKKGYQPTIHSGAISQVAKICKITDLDDKEKDYLRLRDRAIVEFKFVFRPEYIQPDTMLIFREGKTKGIGKIVEVF
jgi:GTPase